MTPRFFDEVFAVGRLAKPINGSPTAAGRAAGDPEHGLVAIHLLDQAVHEFEGAVSLVDDTATPVRLPFEEAQSSPIFGSIRWIQAPLLLLFAAMSRMIGWIRTDFPLPVVDGR